MKFVFILGLLLLSIAQSALATLGEHESKISDNEVKVLKVRAQKIIHNSNYTVHELTLDATTLKEYADSSGAVFAVTWQGIRVPDFSVIMGTYFAEYSAERAKTPIVRGRRYVDLKTNSLVFNSGGHMRNLHGIVYLPAKVPPGVDLNSLQ